VIFCDYISSILGTILFVTYFCLAIGIREAISCSSGATVYISNVATQCGQTEGYTLPKTLEILAQYLGDDAIDYVIANNAIPQPPSPVQPSTVSDAKLNQFVIANGEKLLLPTEEMKMAERPILLQGRAIEDIVAFTAEWNKTPMIKHNGEMIVAMLYRIIEKEMEGMEIRNKTNFYTPKFHDVWSSWIMGGSSPNNRRQLNELSVKAMDEHNSNCHQKQFFSPKVQEKLNQGIGLMDWKSTYFILGFASSFLVAAVLNKARKGA